MATQRTLVRVLVGAALCLALAGWVGLPVPKELPAIALGQATIYRMEVALAAFYGCLLLLTPAYSGLARGRLPVEISTRGARFAEESDLMAERYETSIKDLEQTTDRLSEDLEKATVAITLLHSDRSDRK